MNYNEIENFSSVINDVFDKIHDPASPENKIKNAWYDTLSKIKVIGVNKRDLGLKLAAHTEIVELKNNILLIETDHPGWIQYLNTYRTFILKGLKISIPHLKIESLAFRIKGNNFNLSPDIEEQNKKYREKMLEKAENDQKLLEKDQKKGENSDQLPEDLRKRMELLQQELTNARK